MYTNPLDPTTQTLDTWNKTHPMEELDRKFEKLPLLDNNEVRNRIKEATLRTMPPAQESSMDRLKGRTTIGAHRAQSVPNLFNL